ncbi:hypothetical protein PAMA_012075 [Pampus argenteus]
MAPSGGRKQEQHSALSTEYEYKYETEVSDEKNVPVESSRTSSKPPAFPDTDNALGGGVSGGHPQGCPNRHRGSSRGGGEGRDQKRCLLPQCGADECRSYLSGVLVTPGSLQVERRELEAGEEEEEIGGELEERLDALQMEEEEEEVEERVDSSALDSSTLQTQAHKPEPKRQKLRLLKKTLPSLSLRSSAEIMSLLLLLVLLLFPEQEHLLRLDSRLDSSRKKEEEEVSKEPSNELYLPDELINQDGSDRYQVYELPRSAVFVSEEESRVAARRFAYIIQKLGFPARFLDFKIHNVVASCKMFPVNLAQVVEAHPHQCSYEPELFPALFYNDIPGIKVAVFSSGTMNFSGN